MDTATMDTATMDTVTTDTATTDTATMDTATMDTATMDTADLMRKPEMHQLVEWLDDLVEWETFGLFLPNITDPTISKINRDERRVDDKKRALFSKWLQVCSTATWNHVIDALVKAKYNVLAEDVKTKVTTQMQSSAKREIIKITLPIKDEDEIEESLENLHKNFIDLKKELKNDLLSSSEKFDDIKEYAQDLTDVEDMQSCQSVDELMKKIDSLSDFLDCKITVDLASKYASSSLSTKLREHLKNAKKLRSSQSIKQLREALKPINDSIIADKFDGPIAHIDLNNPWDSLNIEKLYILIRISFPKSAKFSLIKHIIKITSSSVHIEYLLMESPSEISQIVARVRENIAFLKLIGIYGFRINETVILNEEENKTYTFEHSLLLAAWHGNYEAAQFLINLGIDVSHCTDDGETPLMNASYQGHEDIVKILIEAGATPDDTNDGGLTALMLATQKEHPHVVRTLLRAKADAKMKAFEKRLTALHMAILVKHAEIVQMLIPHSDVDASDNRGNTPLIQAVANDQHDIVKMLLDSDTNHSIQNDNGITALILATLKENVIIVEELLNYGANPNTQEKNGDTALTFACEMGNLQMVEQLLLKNADPNIVRRDGSSPLILAGKNKNPQVVKLLLENNASIDRQNNEGWTALMASCQAEHLEVIDLLLAMKANPNIQRYTDGFTALMLACRSGQLRIIDRILQEGNTDTNIQTRDGITALIIAIQNNYITIVQLLLEKGANPNIGIIPPICMACHEGQTEIVKLLLIFGANPNHRIEMGETPLLLASINGYTEIVKDLLEAGALPNIRDNEHRTALMMASINGHHEIVEKLLKQNADVNDFQKLTDRGADFNPTAITFAAIGNHLKVISTLLTKAHEPINLRNAMMLAITKKSIDAMKLFLDAGVNPNFEYKSTITDEYSMEIREVSITPLMHATQMGNTANTIELLLQRGADPNYSPNNAEFTALMLAVMNGDIGIIQKLTQYGGNLNATIDGNNLLHVAIYADSDKAIVIIEMLLERKVDPAAQNIYGVTPLMLAAVSTDPRVVKLLLKQNPQLDSQNNNKKTALMLSSSCGNTEVVDMLLNKGASPNIQDHNDMTALMFACKANHFEVVERLLGCSDIKLKAKNGISAFNLAAYCGNDQLVDAFFEKHTISQDEIAKGIVLACYGGHPTIITLLSEKLTSLTEDQRIMLLSCVCNDLATVTVKILEDGLDPDLPIVCGLTPLMLAASCGHIELVDALIQMGSNVDSQEDFLGCTSLHFAVSGSKSLELVKLLLEDGRADVNVVSDNLTPLDMATLNELNSIVSELKKHGGLTHSELKIQLQQATDVVAHQQEEAKKMSYVIQKNNYDNLAETGLEKVYRIRNDCKNVARKMEITDRNPQQTEVLVY